MHSPLSMQERAHLAAASLPLPARKRSMMPVMISTGSMSARPAGATLGQTATHLPQRVQASAIAPTRASSAVSKVRSLIDGLLWVSRQPAELYHLAGHSAALQQPYAQALTICQKSSSTRLAPPTSAPSTLTTCISSWALAGLT